MIFVLTIINNVNEIVKTKIIGHYLLLVTHYSLLVTHYSLLGIQTPYLILVANDSSQKMINDSNPMHGASL